MDQFYIKPTGNDQYNPTNFYIESCDNLPHSAAYFWKLGYNMTYTSNDNITVDLEHIVNEHTCINYSKTQYINSQDEYLKSNGEPLFPYVDPSKIAGHEGKLTFKSYRYVKNGSDQNIITIPAGMSPHFKQCLFDQNVNKEDTTSIELVRSYDSLQIGNTTYVKDDFPNKVIPIKLLVVAQACGGDGGASGNVVFSGAGGGGGACAICLLDCIASSYTSASFKFYSSENSGSIQLQAYNNGTYRTFFNVNAGATGAVGGGDGGAGGTVTRANTDISRNEITLLKAISGAKGGSDEEAGGSVEGWSYSIVNRQDTGETYSQIKHNGGLKKIGMGGGGGASAHGNGGTADNAASGANRNGGIGAGGCGRLWASTDFFKGIGGPGFIKIYY